MTSAVKSAHCIYNKESVDGSYLRLLFTVSFPLTCERSNCYIYIVDRLSKFYNKAFCKLIIEIISHHVDHISK